MSGDEDEAPELDMDIVEKHTDDTFVELMDLIDLYDPALLTKVDLTEFSGRLSEIRQNLAEAKKKFRAAVKALTGPDVVNDKAVLEDAMKEMSVRVKNHEVSIKKRIEELKASPDEAKSSPTETSTALNKKLYAFSLLAAVQDQANFLDGRLNEAGEIETKSDVVKREICGKRLALTEDMYKIKADFNKARAAVYKENLTMEAAKEVEAATAALGNDLGELETRCFKTVDNLKRIDETSLLYSTSKMTVTVPYPSPKFTGSQGQNVVVWLEKMRQALEDNRVSKSKKVTILRDNLDGQAKKLVSENIAEWEEAVKILKDAFGDPKLLWLQVFNKAKSKLMVWREKYSDKDLNGVDHALEGILVFQEFLREAALMSQSDAHVKLQFENEFNSLCGLCPLPWTRKLLKVEGSHELKLKKFHELLKAEHELLTKLKINYQKEAVLFPKKSQKGDEGAGKAGRDTRVMMTSESSCWSCGSPTDAEDHTHIKEIGMAGCRKFLLKKPPERMKLVNEKSTCRRCLRHKFVKGKQCHAKNKDDTKKYYICTEESCLINALLCSDHGKLNVSEEYQKKLDKAFGRPFENRINLITPSTVQPEHYDEGYEADQSSDAPALEASLKEIDADEQLDPDEELDLDDLNLEELEELEAKLTDTNGNFINMVSLSPDEGVKLLREQAKSHERFTGFLPSQILNIPLGDPIFCFVMVGGKSRDHVAFQDSGAAGALAQVEAIKGNEFNRVIINNNQVDLNLVGGTKMSTNGEAVVAIPLLDGRAQALKATLIDRVTDAFPRVDTSYPAQRLLNKINRDPAVPTAVKEEIKLADINRVAGGQVTFLIGQKYSVCSPDLICKDPVSGLALFKSKYRTTHGGKQYCLAGPMRGLKYLGGTDFNFTEFMGRVHTCRLASLIAPRLDYFPQEIKEEKSEEEDIDKMLLEEDPEDEILMERMEELTDEVLNSLEQPTQEVQFCEVCDNVAENLEMPESVMRVSTTERNVRDFYETEALGLDIPYRCPKCRQCKDCHKGDVFEEISIKDEAEQLEIIDSVEIDLERKRVVAKLPFRVNPEEVLTDNRSVAEKALTRVCTKYDDNVKATIVKAITKLYDNGHCIFEHEFTPQIKEMLEKKTGHLICYEAAFSESVSTPVRPVFNASRNTPGGTNLNDCLFRGTPVLTNLLGVLLGWTFDIYAIVGDISMFYNAFLLDLQDIPYQKFLYKRNLNKDEETIVGVILTLIYGVRSVAAQTEAGIMKLCGMIEKEFPHVADLLRKRRYVDDLAQSLHEADKRLQLKKDVDHCLGKLSMYVKGYTMSGEPPNEKCTKNGSSITVMGYEWFPEVDTFGLNMGPTHFGSKVRGRLDPATEFFGRGGSMKTMDQFVPAKLTRRQASKVFARPYDPLGKLSPYMSKPKLLMRETIERSPVWDDPLPPILREKWVDVFGDLEELREVQFQRARIPEGAAEPLNIRLLGGGDAGGDCLVAGVWVGVQLKDGTWSCKHMLGKSLLPGKTWTMPMRELHAFWMSSAVLALVTNQMEDWDGGKLSKRYLFGDNRIALAWTIYTTAKLLPFHRHRVTEVNKNADESEKFHCPGELNPADGGTKLKNISTSLVGQDSVWENGHPWMKYEQSKLEEVLMSVDKIILDDGQQRILKEAHIVPKFENENKGFAVFVTQNDMEKFDERMRAGQYMKILPPQKFSHRFTVRVYGYVLKYLKNLRRNANRRRLKEGCTERPQLMMEKLKEKPLDLFHVESGLGQATSATYEHQSDHTTLGNLLEFYGCVNVVIGVKKDYGSHSNKKRFPGEPDKWVPRGQPRYFPQVAKPNEVNLTPLDLSGALSLIFMWTSNEVVEFNDKSWVENNCQWKEGILLRKGRIIEDHEIQVAGGAEKYVNVGQLTNINYCVPVIDRYSPWAVSIATHIHRNVKLAKHRGALTCHRVSLSIVFIIRGLSLFRKVNEDCTFCIKQKKKFYERVMGSPHQMQLTISPLFFATMLDLVGPYSTFVPGFERATRNSKAKEYKIHIAIFVCLSTGCINLQIVESQSTTGLAEAVCRFAMEAGTPQIMFPDKQSGLEALMKKVSITLKTLAGQLFNEHGIKFITCPSQAHWQHGKVERVARTVRESIVREEFSKKRLHVLGWQTIAKAIEGVVNDTPIGWISRKANDVAETLEVLTPNTFKFARLNARAPQAPFQLPDVDLRDYTQKVNQLWQVWWKMWQDHYIEQLFERPKWFIDGEEASVGDLVMYKRDSSEFGRHFTMGKIDEVSSSHDGRVRNVWIRYKLAGEKNSRRVERDVKCIFKLMSIENTSLHSMLEQAWKLSNKVIEMERAGEELIVESKQFGKDLLERPPEIETIEDVEGSDKNPVKMRKKRLTEVEKLKQWSVNVVVSSENCEIETAEKFISILMKDHTVDHFVKFRI